MSNQCQTCIPPQPRRAPSGWWIIPAALLGTLIGGALAAWVWL